MQYSGKLNEMTGKFKNNKKTKKFNKKKNTIGQKPKFTKVSLPTRMNYSRRGGASMSWGTAPYNEEMGTGLRMNASFIGHAVVAGGDEYALAHKTAIFEHCTLSTTAGTYSSTAAAEAVITSNRCTGDSSGFVREGSVMHIRKTPGGTDNMSRLALLTTYFTRTAVRKWTATYIPSVGTEISGDIVFGVTRMDDGIPTGLSSTVVDNCASVVSTPCYKSTSLTLVNDLSRKAASRTYAQSGSSFDTRNPVALIGYNTVAKDNTNRKVLGNLKYDIVIDCYGLSDEAVIFTDLISRTTIEQLMNKFEDRTKIEQKVSKYEKEEKERRSILEEKNKDIKPRELLKTSEVKEDYVLLSNLNLKSPRQ